MLGKDCINVVLIKYEGEQTYLLIKKDQMPKEWEHEQIARRRIRRRVENYRKEGYANNIGTNTSI